LVVALGPTHAVAMTALATRRPAARRPSVWTDLNKVFLSGHVYQVTRFGGQTRHGRHACQMPTGTLSTSTKPEARARPTKEKRPDPRGPGLSGAYRAALKLP
jgi:hypothetical protein